MRAYPVKTPGIVQSIFRKYKWRYHRHKKPEHGQDREIYLTFDDGPTKEITPWVLEQLGKYKAKGTFFCIGENVKKHPEIFKKIISEGHSFGNHTNDHLNGWKTNKKNYLNNIDKAEKRLWFATSGLRSSVFSLQSSVFNLQSSVNSQKTNNKQLTTILFRPPYGRINPNCVNQILRKGYKIIMWDVLSGDFDLLLSKEKCLQNVLKYTNHGSIVVFHDSQKSFKNLEYVLPKTLEYFSEKGYVFKGI